MVGASNVFNQIIERDLDLLMDRTKDRPLPSGKMTVRSAFILGSILAVAGIAVLYIINPITAMFGAISIFMYVSLYTPLKTRTPLSVFVGAFPGAIPFMLGWVAATGSFGIEAGVILCLDRFGFCNSCFGSNRQIISHPGFRRIDRNYRNWFIVLRHSLV